MNNKDGICELQGYRVKEMVEIMCICPLPGIDSANTPTAPQTAAMGAGSL